MIEIAPIEELRETRRRLAEQCAEDVQRYAEMLREVSGTFPGVYVTEPLFPLEPVTEGAERNK